MNYRLTDFGRHDAKPTAYQNIHSWKKVKLLLEREGVVSEEKLIKACVDHDHGAGPTGFIRHILRNEWIEEAK
jgi:hypothetical protein